MLLRWLEREIISSSEGSLSSQWPRPSRPPGGLLGSVGSFRKKRGEHKETQKCCQSKMKNKVGGKMDAIGGHIFGEMRHSNKLGKEKIGSRRKKIDNGKLNA